MSACARRPITRAMRQLLRPIAATSRLLATGRLPRAAAAYVALGVAAIVVYALTSSAAVQSVLYLAVGASAVVAVAVGVRLFTPDRTAHWWLFAGGVAMFGLGDLIWGAYEVLGHEVPFPSIADVAYLAGYPLLAAGAWRLRKAGFTTRDALDVAIVGTAATMAIFLVLVSPQLDVPQSLLAKGTSAAYPLADVLLLVAFAPLVLRRRAAPAAALLLASCVFLLVADFAYAHLLATESYEGGVWLDHAWLFSYVLLGAAALHPSMRAIHLAEPRGVAAVWPRIALLSTAIGLAVVCIASARPAWDAAYVVTVALAALGSLLVFARLAVLLFDQKAAEVAFRADRERLDSLEAAQQELAGDGLPLEAATQAIAERVLALTRADGVAILLADGKDALAVTVGAGILAETVGRSPSRATGFAAAALAAGKTAVADDAAADERVDQRLRGEIGAASLAASPLHYAGSNVGVLVLASRRRAVFGERELRTLELMASLASVAMSKSAEFAAKQALAAIVDSSRDAVIGHELDGTIVSWNGAAETMYGYTAAEAVGRDIRMLVPTARHAEVDELLGVVVGGDRVDVETERVPKDGAPLHVALTVSPVRDLHGRVVGASTIERDVSERRRLEEQLHQAQRMEAVGRLAGGIAHDFNNLLLAINGSSELLLAETDSAAVRERALEIRRAGDRAAELTQQLLAFGRRQTLQPRVLSPNEVVVETNRMLERIVGEDVRIECRLDETLGAVTADPGQLGQVIVNLAVNARDAMPGGGVITVETASVELDATGGARLFGAAPGRYARLTVSDTGTGMDDATRAQAFEPFFTTKPQGKGTGLGLATVYGIVKQSAGYVTLESELGVGTTVSVYLPLAAPDERLQPARPEPPAAPMRGSESIVLVEDEDIVRDLVAQMLRSFGYDVVALPSAADALALCTPELRCDLLLTDVVMPGMNGTELAECFRLARPGVRVVYISGYATDALGEQPLAAADGFLQKPFSLTQLAETVRAALGPAAGAARRAA